MRTTIRRYLSSSVHPKACIEFSAKLGEDTVISSNVFIGKNASIGRGTVILPGAFIGVDVEIGEFCMIGPGVSLQNCRVGNRVCFKPGSQIGQDGFGFIPSVGKCDVKKKPQELKVIIEDEVEIGANSTVDRGSWRNTEVGSHTKIDNLVQIGHNVVIGKNCLIAAQTGIAGSTTIGDRVLIGGQVGIAQHLQIGNDSMIAGKSGVIQSFPPFSRIGGFPATNLFKFHRSSILAKKNLSLRL